MAATAEATITVVVEVDAAIVMVMEEAEVVPGGMTTRSMEARLAKTLEAAPWHSRLLWTLLLS